MHQHPRPPPVSASPALSTRTNPMRTNNQREADAGPSSGSGQNKLDYNEGDEESEDSRVIGTTGPEKATLAKLDQMIQNFYAKTAVLILQSRMQLEAMTNRDGSRRFNRWFGIQTEDISAFRSEMSQWRACGAFKNRPPTLTIETFFDTSHLTSNQSLVIVDEQGKRWGVAEGLNKVSRRYQSANRPRKPKAEIILERWKFELGKSPGASDQDFSSDLPVIYKKCLVFVRSLYTTAQILPASRFVKNFTKNTSSSASGLLRLNCRIVAGDIKASGSDALSQPLFDSDSPVTTDYSFGFTETPAGKLSASVTYRNECSFRIDDSETLLSSRFMGVDEHYFKPSLGSKRTDRHREKLVEVGSLPAHRYSIEEQEPIQAYGSLSTFHGDAPPLGSSPVSALRNQKALGSEMDGDSPPTSYSRAHSMQASRSSIRSLEGLTMARRPSVLFQPFKAGSLSSSPGRQVLQQVNDLPPPQSPQSIPREYGIGTLTQARNRSSLTAGMPASLRGGPAPPSISDAVSIPSGSTSPKPAPISRYSSSFTHRRNRPSFGGASKVEDDQGSSGKQSPASSVQPGSSILAEGAGNSSGSLQTDDDNISEFLKLLDSKKILQSFEPSSQSAKRTSAQLSRFQSMRDSNNALTESMISSAMLHRSSSSSSRHLSSVPPMVAANSMSVSSSPGKPISPHTPHTPAIPSRLSANSIVAGVYVPQSSPRSERGPQDSAHDDQSNVNAIDIPTSPRPYHQHTRRSSSVAQQHRSVVIDEDLGEPPFGPHRSISLGAEDREPPSLSALLGIVQAADNADSTSPASPPLILQPAPHISEATTAMSCQPSSSMNSSDSIGPHMPRGLSSTSFRPRLGQMRGRGTPASQGGSYSSLERASGSATSERGVRPRAAGLYEADDELLFDMSELHPGRRSTEEPRGSDNIRGGDSGSSSRRRSRR
ncbi:autophagy protein-like protein Atg13 [Calycina marina]|uniref:Autophagy-related protein 13 n=1 Tax=Calycina marina TaxID=1763456 RepID=A0A9P8CCT0_9HELO|nr:autophagy protein-like protein Atg13 [Calycina marina]